MAALRAEHPDRPRLQPGDNDLAVCFSFEALAALALVVREPDGHWRCNDDHGRGWQNPTMPALDFIAPRAGRYDIWVGSFDASANNPASLYVTEVDGHHL